MLNVGDIVLITATNRIMRETYGYHGILEKGTLTSVTGQDTLGSIFCVADRVFDEMVASAHSCWISKRHYKILKRR